MEGCEDGEVRFTVPVMPVPWRIGATKKGIIYIDKHTRRFQKAVSSVAVQFRDRKIPYPKPVFLHITVFLHYRVETFRMQDFSGGWNVKVPDNTNILKAVEDALTGILYDDDVQVISNGCSRVWVPSQESGKIYITVKEERWREYACMNHDVKGEKI